MPDYKKSWSKQTQQIIDLADNLENINLEKPLGENDKSPGIFLLTNSLQTLPILAKYLEAGLNPNIKDSEDIPLLMNIFMYYSPNQEEATNLIKLLLSKGADLFALITDYFTQKKPTRLQLPLFHWLVYWTENSDWLIWLIKENYADINARDPYNATILHHYAHKGDIKNYSIFLFLGADPNIKSSIEESQKTLFTFMNLPIPEYIDKTPDQLISFNREEYQN